jgi:hypothetical protein
MQCAVLVQQSDRNVGFGVREGEPAVHRLERLHLLPERCRQIDVVFILLQCLLMHADAQLPHWLGLGLQALAFGRHFGQKMEQEEALGGEICAGERSERQTIEQQISRSELSAQQDQIFEKARRKSSAKKDQRPHRRIIWIFCQNIAEEDEFCCMLSYFSPRPYFALPTHPINRKHEKKDMTRETSLKPSGGLEC